MGNNCGLDERQLKIRGDILRRALILVIVLLLVNAFLLDSGTIWIADAFWQALLIIMLPIVACSIEMVVRDVYVGRNRGMRRIPYLLGVCGLAVIVFSAVDIARGDRFIAGGELTDSGAQILLGALLFTLFAVFAIKKSYDKRHASGE